MNVITIFELKIQSDNFDNKRENTIIFISDCFTIKLFTSIQIPIYPKSKTPNLSSKF